MPATSWLTNYLIHTEKIESPRIFHLWTALTTMAAAMNRKVWLDRRDQGVTWYRVYPGYLMTVLVGPAGEGKSSAIRLGRKLMEGVGVKVLLGKGSTEKIIDILANTNGVVLTGTRISTQPPNAIATIVSPELSVMISKQTYADSMVDFLTQSYDAEDRFDYMTMKHGVVTLPNHCITLLGGTTPVSLGRSMPEKSHTAGWSARVVHVYHDKFSPLGAGEKPKPANPMVDVDDSDIDPIELAMSQQREKQLLDDLREINKMSGAVTYTKTGREWFREWYTKWRESELYATDSWSTRRHDHLSRVAILLRASQYGDLSLDDAAQDSALVLIEDIEVEMHKCFSYVGRTQLAEAQDHIVTIFKQNQGAITTPLLLSRTRYLFKDHREFDYAMATLVKAGIIIYNGKNGKGVEEWSLKRRS